MASLYLVGGEELFKWQIQGLGAAFNQANGYVAAGLTVYTFTQSTTSFSHSGDVATISAPSSGGSTSTTLQTVYWGDMDNPLELNVPTKLYAWVLTSDGTYHPAGSGTVTVTEATKFYYVTVSYKANGGSGAPSSSEFFNTSSTVACELSTTIPTRSGYTFLGWASYSSATEPEYYAGGTYYFTGSTSGTTVTLYAVWSEAKKDHVVYIDGKPYIPYIYNGSAWNKYAPYVYNGTWIST